MVGTRRVELGLEREFVGFVVGGKVSRAIVDESVSVGVSVSCSMKVKCCC